MPRSQRRAPRRTFSDEVPPEALAAHQRVSLDVLQDEAPPATRPEAPVDEQPNLPGFIFVASQTDKELQPREIAREVHHAGIRERVARIRTKGDARDYFEEVRRKLVAAEPELDTDIARRFLKKLRHLCSTVRSTRFNLRRHLLHLSPNLCPPLLRRFQQSPLCRQLTRRASSLRLCCARRNAPKLLRPLVHRLVGDSAPLVR